MRKRKWLALGALGTVVGMAVKLVKGRREEAAEAARYEPPPPPPPPAEPAPDESGSS